MLSAQHFFVTMPALRLRPRRLCAVTSCGASRAFCCPRTGTLKAEGHRCAMYSQGRSPGPLELPSNYGCEHRCAMYLQGRSIRSTHLIAQIVLSDDTSCDIHPDTRTWRAIRRSVPHLQRRLYTTKVCNAKSQCLNSSAKGIAQRRSGALRCLAFALVSMFTALAGGLVL